MSHLLSTIERGRRVSGDPSSSLSLDLSVSTDSTSDCCTSGDDARSDADGDGASSRSEFSNSGDAGGLSSWDELLSIGYAKTVENEEKRNRYLIRQSRKDTRIYIHNVSCVGKHLTKMAQ